MINRESLVSATFVELTDTLVDDFDVIDLLTLLADRCTELVGADATGILLADHDDVLRVIAASSERARLVELFQIQNEQGPCLDCFSTGITISCSDLRSDTRWPLFAEEALASDFASVQAVPLRLRSQIIGALNIFFRLPTTIPPEDLALAQSLADVATIAILQVKAAQHARTVSTQLQAALSSRIAIEQAKGIIAERAQIDMEQAFTRLRRFARNENRLLSTVAGEVVDGRLDDDAVARLLASG